MSLRTDLPETESLAHDLASMAKAGRGLFAKSLALQMQDTLTSLAQKDEERLCTLRNEKKEAEELFKLSDAENQDLRSKKKQLEEENGSLKIRCESYKNHFDKAQSDAGRYITLKIKCNISEKFPAEIEEYFKSLLWEAANKAKPNLDKDSHLRQFQVLEDFILSNGAFAPQNSKAEKLAEDIKAAFKQDNTDKWLKALSNCGFEIVPEQNRHHKIRYHGDNAFQFSPSTTPSDKRGAKNLEHEIINKCLLLVNRQP